ncbi:MAG: cadherin domain-containing protein, partial [Gammaproteobacteria bacterium]|nr:cadherin domain-containing protein [Gammaproteobacteria bacterium]
MIVGVSMDAQTGASVTGVTYNGSALSLLGTVQDAGSNVRVELWQMVAPADGTHDVVVSFSQSMTEGGIAGVMTFNGVDQTTPLGSFASAQGIGTTASVDISTAAGDLVFSTMGVDGSTDDVLNPDAGQTEYWETFQPGTEGAGSTKVATSTSETMSWTFLSNQWAIGGVAIKASDGANAAPVITSGSGPGQVFINEFHYDNEGTDTGEAIEIAGLAGTDLTGWSLVLYNGLDSAVYHTEALSGTFANQSDGYGTLTFNFPTNGIQNGSPDGIALVDDSGTVIEFISYEGTLTASGGPADGMTSVDIGVAEDGTTLIGDSLQLTGAGPTYTWQAASANTFGSINTGQSFASLPQGTNYSIPENTTAITTVTATDADGDTVTFSISGGADAALFNIHPNSGVLTFITAPDFETPLDANTDNVYEVTVQASDGTDTDTQVISITVTDQAITTVSASGAASVDGGSTYTLNLSADEDATSWTINWGDGSIQTVAGNPGSITHVYDAGFKGLTMDILVSATDGNGVHFNNDVIVPTAFLTGEGLFRFDGISGTYTQTFSGAELTNPYTAIIGPDGLLYVAGHTSDNIVRYNAETGAYVDTFVSAGSGGLNAAAGITFGADGHLYVSNQIGDSILKYDGSTGAFLGTFVTAGSGGLNGPTDMEFRNDGYLYVVSYNTNSVLRYDATTGAFADTFISTGSGGLNGPGSLAWGPDGNIYIGGTNSVIKRFDGSTGAFIDNFVTANLGGLGEGIGIAFGPDGHLYVASFSTDQIIKYDGNTGALIGDFVAAGTGGLDGPTSFTFMPTLQVEITSNDAPVLTGANNLISIDEDPVSNTGTLVSTLIAGQVTDADAGALTGIAVVGVDDTNGSWEYTTDGGSNWYAFGAVDSTSARLLAADANTSV